MNATNIELVAITRRQILPSHTNQFNINWPRSLLGLVYVKVTHWVYWWPRSVLVSLSLAMVTSSVSLHGRGQSWCLFQRPNLLLMSVSAARSVFVSLSKAEVTPGIAIDGQFHFRCFHPLPRSFHVSPSAAKVIPCFFVHGEGRWWYSWPRSLLWLCSRSRSILMFPTTAEVNLGVSIHGQGQSWCFWPRSRSLLVSLFTAKVTAVPFSIVKVTPGVSVANLATGG